MPAQSITLAAVLIVINVTWQAPLAWAARIIRGGLVRSPVRRAGSRLTGAIPLLFAGLMLYEHLV